MLKCARLHVNAVGVRIKRTYAIQYAKTFKVNVTAVCSSKNFDIVKSLGADQVIDYTKDDFTKRPEKYDLIFDTVGRIKLVKWKKSLKPDGIFLYCGSPSMGIIRFMLRVMFNRFRKKKIKFLIAKANPGDFTFLAKLMADGKLKSIIDKSYPLPEIVKAHQLYDSHRTVGKVVVTVSHAQ